MSLRSPYATKIGRGGYSAGVYKEGDTIVAEDSVGTVIKEGTTVATVIQAAIDATKNVFFAEGTYNIGGTTLTLPDKSMKLHGTGIDSLIKGSADPLIDVTLTNEYQLKLHDLAIHTTSTNKGVHIDGCSSRLPIWLNNVHFVPEGHAGTLVYIKGMAAGHITNCSFQETQAAHPTTTAKGVYMTADATKYAQELYITGSSFYYLNYGLQGYATSANRAYLAGLHIADSLLYRVTNPLNFECVDDISINGITIDSPSGADEGIIVNDCISTRIVGNRLATGSTTAQVQIIGTALDCYKNTISGNYILSYSRAGDGIKLDSSPGNKFTEAIITGNTFDLMIDAIQATSGTTWYPQIIFTGNHVWDCTWNITGAIDHSIIIGNVWGSGCSSTVVNGISGTSEIAHNHKR